MPDLEAALRDEGAWRSLVGARLAQLRHFLGWAAACESGGTETSLRFRNRSDVERCRSVLGLFDEAWWGVVVFSCFDSVVGAQTAAEHFASPLPPTEAERVVETIDWPQGSVRGHRKQSGNRGAKASLVSVCDKADELEEVICAKGMTFEERFDELGRIDVRWWGRRGHRRQRQAVRGPAAEVEWALGRGHRPSGRPVGRRALPACRL